LVTHDEVHVVLPSLKELQSTRVLVKLLEWGMVGESTALCQSLMTVATGVGGTIGSALVAEKSDAALDAQEAHAAAKAKALLIAKAAAPPPVVEDTGSVVSSTVDGADASMSRVQRLELKLAQEEAKRRDLEKELDRSRGPPSII